MYEFFKSSVLSFDIKMKLVLPVVTRFLCPPEIPLNIAFPTIVSAQTSSPRICKYKTKREREMNTTLYNDLGQSGKKCEYIDFTFRT